VSAHIRFLVAHLPAITITLGDLYSAVSLLYQTGHYVSRRAHAENADSTRIAYLPRANINGGNPDGNSEIYYFYTTTGIITQIMIEVAGRYKRLPPACLNFPQSVPRSCDIRTIP